MGDANYIKEKHRNLMYRGKNVPICARVFE